MKVIGIVILIVVLVCIAGVGYHVITPRHHHQAVQPQLAADHTVLPATPAKTLGADLLPFTAMNIVHRREGLENPMIRQLMADPDLAVNAHIKGVKAFMGDRNDTAALKKWAGGVAQILVENSGSIGPHFHEEFRVRAPETVAVVIVKDSDGYLRIVQYAVHENAATAGTTGTSITTFAPIATQSVATTSAAARFIGPQDGTTVLPLPYQHFEYMFVPN